MWKCQHTYPAFALEMIFFSVKAIIYFLWQKCKTDFFCSWVKLSSYAAYLGETSPRIERQMKNSREKSSFFLVCAMDAEDTVPDHLYLYSFFQWKMKYSDRNISILTGFFQQIIYLRKEGNLLHSSWNLFWIELICGYTAYKKNISV